MGIAPPYRVLLVESLMRPRSKEGGFHDAPILAWDGCTALALLALTAREPLS